MDEITKYRIAVQHDNQRANLISILNTVRKEHTTRYIDNLIDYLSKSDSVSFQLRKQNVTEIIKEYLI